MSADTPSRVSPSATETPEKILAGFYTAVVGAQGVIMQEFRRIEALGPAVNKARMLQLANILDRLADGRKTSTCAELRVEARWLRSVAESLK